MDKADKFTQKLEKHEALRLRDVIKHIRLNHQLSGIDVKKLKGGDEEYRVRMGRVRIRFLKTDKLNVIIDVGFRNDNTY